MSGLASDGRVKSTRSFSGEGSSVPAARRFAVETLDGAPERVGAADQARSPSASSRSTSASVSGSTA